MNIETALCEFVDARIAHHNTDKIDEVVESKAEECIANWCDGNAADELRYWCDNSGESAITDWCDNNGSYYLRDWCRDNVHDIVRDFIEDSDIFVSEIKAYLSSPEGRKLILGMVADAIKKEAASEQASSV
jgi:hypothetical protein